MGPCLCPRVWRRAADVGRARDRGKRARATPRRRRGDPARCAHRNETAWMSNRSVADKEQYRAQDTATDTIRITHEQYCVHMALRRALAPTHEKRSMETDRT